MSDEKAPEYAGALAEFSALRSEIEERIRAQLQILFFQLTITGAVFGFVLSTNNNTGMLLVLPISSYLLCGRLVSLHFGILFAARYIREVLSARVPDGLGWEQWQRASRLQETAAPRPIWVLVLPLQLAFTGTGALALAWSFPAIFAVPDFWQIARVGMAVVWLTGALATAISARLLVKARMRAVGKSD
ncbi:MAG TPA: hypothetical protein VF062_14745 [Candidatus Limnocylindrales bacterium]